MSCRWMVFELPRAPGVLAESGTEVGARVERCGDAPGHFCSLCEGVMGHCDLQRGVFWTAKLVNAGDGVADGSFAATCGGFGRRIGWVWWSDGGNRIRATCWLSARSWHWLQCGSHAGRNVSRRCLCCNSARNSDVPARGY